MLLPDVDRRHHGPIDLDRWFRGLGAGEAALPQIFAGEAALPQILMVTPAPRRQRNESVCSSRV